MQPLHKGRYVARLAGGGADLQACLQLRARCFGAAAGADRFDTSYQHLLVADAGSGQVLCSLRLAVWNDGPGLEQGYSAQVYDLATFAALAGAKLEIGRFCIDPGRADPDIARIAWAALTRIVDAQSIGWLFGCASFSGARAGLHQHALAQLAAHHLAPPVWCPGIKAARITDFAQDLQGFAYDPRRAAQTMPILLRSYLAMGGRVSGHAVIDRDLDTLHVFTGVEVAGIPPARARALRAVAQ